MHQQKTYLLLFFIVFVYAVNINVFHGTYSYYWNNCNNWSLNKCPDRNTIVFIPQNMNCIMINNNVIINTLVLCNSNLIIQHSWLNITNDYHNDGFINIINTTMYIWKNITINSGYLSIHNSNFIPNGNLIINKHVLLNGMNLIPTHIHIIDTLRLLPKTSLLMSYSYNLTQYDSGKIIIYGFPCNKLYMQQFIMMCYTANMNGTLQVEFDGYVGTNKTSFWYFIMPALLQYNFYNFTINSNYYNVNVTKLFDDSLAISITDKIFYI
jgi:hypothetical protein